MTQKERKLIIEKAKRISASCGTLMMDSGKALQEEGVKLNTFDECYQAARVMVNAIFDKAEAMK